MPPDLALVPRADARGHDLFRLHLLADPETGHARTPLHFSSRSPVGGRFDLAAPRGTCYLSDARVGAWVECFRGARLVDVRDVRRRGLTTTRCPRAAALLDFTAPESIAAEITLDQHAGNDRVSTWAIADAADAAPGVRGISSWARHDPSPTGRTVTLFDVAGELSPLGWAWKSSTSDPLSDPVLLAELAARGLGVATVPHDLPVTRPPKRS